MPKLKNLKKIHMLTHLPTEETKLFLGMLAYKLLDEKRITLAEIDELHAELLAGLAEKKR
jgi:hypothetical protein